MKYLSFLRIRLIAGLQYRTAAFAGAVTQMIWGLMEIFLFRAFYLTAPEKMPMSIQSLSSYIWLQQSTLCIWMLYQWETELFEAVRSGAVAYELTRPFDLYTMWFTRGIALRLSRAIMRMGPVLLLGILMPSPYGLRFSISPCVFILAIGSLFLTLWLCAAIVVLCYSFTFFFTDYRGIINFVPAVCEVLSGDLIPLPFYPAPLQHFAELSPFGSLQNVPLRIFSGDISGAQILPSLLLQCFWCITITALGYYLMHLGIRRAVIAGG